MEDEIQEMHLETEYGVKHVEPKTKRRGKSSQSMVKEGKGQ